MPAGTPPPNPSELLNSRRTGDPFELLANTVDVVIVDTPPIGPVTDAALLAARADGVRLVAAVGGDRPGAVWRARQTLDVPGVRLLGMVVNKASAKTTSYDRYDRPVAEAPPRPEARRWAKVRRSRAANGDRVPSRT